MPGRFAELLRRHRIEAEFTQEELAERAKLSVRTIRRFETAERAEARMATVRLVADALGLGSTDREELLAAAVGAADVDVAARPGPRQLPAPPGMFLGHHDELAALDKALDRAGGRGGTVVVSAISGGGGVGKTWLALRWAYDNLARFPDGQLFVDLRGFAPASGPMEPAEAVRGFLDALGVASAAVPTGLDAQVGMYRSLVADKRMLIVLDNARDTEQVTPLLPGNPGCIVVVTSRDRLAGLATRHDATLLPLGTLADDDAWALLACRLGHYRLAAEPRAVAALLHFCAGLPLALAVVAARATLYPDFTLAALANELSDSAARLSRLDAGDPTSSVQAALSWTHDALDPTSAEVFALLGVACGPEISLPAAVSLTALTGDRATAALRALERVSLLRQHAPGRYRMHDLVKLFAADRAKHLDPELRGAALQRLIDYYLHTASRAEQLRNPHLPPVQLDPPAPGCRPCPLADSTAADTWFDAERPNLLAAQQLAVQLGWRRQVWQLAWSMRHLGWRSGPNEECLAVWRAGLSAADDLGDPAAQIIVRRYLGHVHILRGQYEEALELLEQALAMAEDIADLTSQGHVHRYLSGTWERYGDDEKALDHATRALRLFEAVDTPVMVADSLNLVGWTEARLGRHEQARDHCLAALELCRRHGNREGEAYTLDSLGYIFGLTGDHQRSREHYRQARTLFRDRGETYVLAGTVEKLGQAHLGLGDRDQARAAWEEALGLYRSQHRVEDAGRVSDRLAALEPVAEQ
ncbi:ATP-binding protein [Kutzneria sp. CA-103260]|uniref:ATP-binding protein n=1 Tax=Kutzneria sp. CA-103260 TaxID=2802641 RepID=UPI001BA9A9D5|nr:XRE family transcriptional regulator [Kutzneria sp. CA-103260]QUQ67513.1 SARP family transcriptional regulator [Kutzneria sp. CA-103260]